MQWIRIQLSQKKKRKATGQHRKQKDRGRPEGGRPRSVLVTKVTQNGPTTVAERVGTDWSTQIL